jgi:hypothetical protein
VRQQRAACHRPRNHLGLVEHRRGQHVEQVLREAPYGGRLPQQLVRIQVDAPMVAVAEIEVAVQHQHLVRLQFLQRLIADLFSSIHRCSWCG